MNDGLPKSDADIEVLAAQIAAETADMLHDRLRLNYGMAMAQWLGALHRIQTLEGALRRAPGTIVQAHS